MKILVTGGAGYIGAVLVGHAARAGYDVRVLDRLYWGARPLERRKDQTGDHQRRRALDR